MTFSVYGVKVKVLVFGNHAYRKNTVDRDVKHYSIDTKILKTLKY